MYDDATREHALTRLRSGESLRQLQRTTGISLNTLREWRARGGAYADKHICPCFLCRRGESPPTQPYLYLLGQYLGDGCVDRMGRSWVLRIATCDAYPGIRAEVVDAITQLVSNRVHFVAQQGCTTVGCITRQWLHLLPQHGPGRKHERPIILTAWQSRLVASNPRPLIRGLMHSDGWRGDNWTERRVGQTTKRYTYSRYLFSNRSDDILRIFTDALDLAGVEWKQNNRWSISIARRDAVARL
ncbi:MAG: hypothetical protein JO079_06305, partial [Frankiaceae bacterium]|nr:hypothetical protein [Frankiaceae bacterium]